ncbi:DDHD domain-containing protein [Zychaea mexicana]|uniref:DDHD domain-containing protein n=1 Tax=Zychaea mexicana TaxID=64656 RepID=UPI0022FED9AA|nr:DDHD domain-containing protein [Zychaea mexicana]KAI9490325.1 DDHD domain-containing protein [Zychaea mexicana]
MPKTIPTIRLIESDYLSDVMFYFTKERGQSIINHVTSSFNQLGGLISWDILSHQRQDLTPQEMEQLGKYDVNFPKLDFQPDFLFGMGCPMAGLLVARDQDPRYYHPDYRTVYENIFHPMDPLAFRLEPLLNHDFDEPAVAIERAIPQQPSSFASMVFSLFRGSNATTIAKEQNQTGRCNTMPSLATGAAASALTRMSPAVGEVHDDVIMPTPSLSATPTSSCPTTAPQTPTSEHLSTPLLSSSVSSSSCWNGNDEEFCDIGRMSSSLLEEKQQDAKQPALPLGRRYDYELTPESLMGMISNEYILGLRAHFSYWNNKDMLWHIFRRMEDMEH